jgi:predicted dehydrogenase
LDVFFGAIEKVAGFAANQRKAYEAEDIVVGSFVFTSGVLGTGNWCFTTNEAANFDQTQICGSRGKISFETFGKGEFILELEGEDLKHFSFGLSNRIQHPLIETIVGDLLEKSTCKSLGSTAARANLVMDQLTKVRVDYGNFS